MESGKKFRYAEILKVHNTAVKNLLIDNSAIIPGIYKKDVEGLLKISDHLIQLIPKKPFCLSYRPDIAHNMILESRANGKKLSVGQRVTKGSKIDLVIGVDTEGSKDD